MECPYDDRLEDYPGEKWLPLPDLGEKYLISNYGRVKSLARTVIHGYEHRGRMPLQERVFLPRLTAAHKSARICVTISPRKVLYLLIAREVYSLFIEPIPERHVVRFYDDNPTNTHWRNLYLMSRSDLLKANTGR